MKAELISIGDELLIGQTINTNASWLGQQLSQIGISIRRTIAVADDKTEILEALDASIKRAELVIITGGLGPTKDDITKHTLCEYFNTTLEIHIPTLQKVEAFFRQRNRPMLESNIKQAELPVGCKILENNYGTAAGMWFEKNGSIVLSLPGVPYEMKGIMTEGVLPQLQKDFDLRSIYHQTLLTQGIGESFLAERIASWENEVRASGLGLAYLPSPGMVKLRLTSENGSIDKPLIDAFFDRLKVEMPHYIFGEGDQTLSHVVGACLKDRGLTIGTVESCTGGGLAGAITSVSGASDYFLGSFLTYSNSLKEKLVEVDPGVLDEFGAVSREVVEQMAANGRRMLGVDVCVSTSGIAGPTGGTPEKPVGLVWIGVATKDQVISRKFQFGDNRERNIQMTILTALNLVRCEILGILDEKK